MKKFLLVIVCLILSANISFAEKISDFETAQEDLFCALSSMAAYSGDINSFARSSLLSRDWTFNALTTKNSRANVKAYFISKGDKKIFVIAGTEDEKDIEVDFRVGRVGLSDDDKVGDDKIFVHPGFRDYADAALSDGVKNFLLDELKKNPAETLYITGHSLGGAVALMSAVRLIDSGADKNRIKVVTFGAPALGNRIFADTYQDKINLRRIGISGDIIKKSLQVLGYVQFGNFVQYKAKDAENYSAHSMALYLDCALKNYYDSGGMEKSLDADKKFSIDTPVYVAPIKILKKSFKAEEEKYILPLMTDGLKVRLANLTFAEPRFSEVQKADQLSSDVTEYLEPAQKVGAKFILVQLLRARAVKESKRSETKVVLDEMIFDSQGSLLSMQTAGATTEDLTVIEAAAFAQESLSNNREEIFTGRQKNL